MEVLDKRKGFIARMETINNRTHKDCSICGDNLPVEDFPKGRSQCTPCFGRKERERCKLRFQRLKRGEIEHKMPTIKPKKIEVVKSPIKMISFSGNIFPACGVKR